MEFLAKNWVHYPYPHRVGGSKHDFSVLICTFHAIASNIFLWHFLPPPSHISRKKTKSAHIYVYVFKAPWSFLKPHLYRGFLSPLCTHIYTYFSLFCFWHVVALKISWATMDKLFHNFHHSLSNVILIYTALYYPMWSTILYKLIKKIISTTVHIEVITYVFSLCNTLLYRGPYFVKHETNSWALIGMCKEFIVRHFCLPSNQLSCQVTTYWWWLYCRTPILQARAHSRVPYP